MALFAKKSLINANNRAQCVPPTLVLGHLPVRPVEALAGCSAAGVDRQRAAGTVAAGQHPRLAGAHPLVHQHKALGIGADVGAQQAAAARHYAWEEWIDKLLYAISSEVCGIRKSHKSVLICKNIANFKQSNDSPTNCADQFVGDGAKANIGGEVAEADLDAVAEALKVVHTGIAHHSHAVLGQPLSGRGENKKFIFAYKCHPIGYASVCALHPKSRHERCPQRWPAKRRTCRRG
jgi:hypothetical protein